MTPIAVLTRAFALGGASMELMLWNIALTGSVGFMAFMAKSKFEEFDRLGILLNKTREEVARDHVTRAEINSTIDRLGERFDRAVERLEKKLDDMHRS
jgi:hypothetical protein